MKRSAGLVLNYARPSHKPNANKTCSDSAETTARTLWSCHSAIDSHSIGPANRCAGLAGHMAIGQSIGTVTIGDEAADGSHVLLSLDIDQ